MNFTIQYHICLGREQALNISYQWGRVKSDSWEAMRIFLLHRLILLAVMTSLLTEISNG